MKKTILFSLLVLIFGSTSLIAQKTISEGTISYAIQIKNMDNVASKDSAMVVTYLKGFQSRTDMVNTLGSETTITDAKTGNAVILKQYSGQKLMITLTRENWDNKYSKFKGIEFKPTTETKEIAGYTCKKAIAQLKDGTTFFVYYAPDINVINKEYNPVFKSLPGLPVQYEVAYGKHVFGYTLSAINFNPIPSAKFDIPKSGYRIMPYNSGN